MAAWSEALAQCGTGETAHAVSDVLAGMVLEARSEVRRLTEERDSARREGCNFAVRLGEVEQKADALRDALRELDDCFGVGPQQGTFDTEHGAAASIRFVNASRAARAALASCEGAPKADHPGTGVCKPCQDGSEPYEDGDGARRHVPAPDEDAPTRCTAPAADRPGTEPVVTPWVAFHRAWSHAHDAPNYNKRTWMDAEAQMIATGHRPAPSPCSECGGSKRVGRIECASGRLTEGQPCSKCQTGGER
jgi:hypothetical protein